MAFVGVLRELWRHRLLVLLGIVVALVAQLLLTYHVTLGIPPQFESRQYDVGVASSAVLIDSQSSQVADLGSGGDEVQVDVGSLSARAKLLANLLVTRPLRDDIAIASKVQPDRLITELSSTTEPGAPPPEASDATVQREDPDANIVSLQTSDTVPIITVNAQAPTEQTASRLAASTVETLRSYLASVVSSNRVPDIRQLVMRPLGEPTSATSGRGPGNSRAATIFVLLLALWCAGILGVSALSTAWRQALVADQFEPDLGPDPADLAPDPEDEAPAGIAPADVGEGPDDELRSVPPPKTTSRVA